jgi:mono/diheme cytochrome c family protein
VLSLHDPCFIRAGERREYDGTRLIGNKYRMETRTSNPMKRVRPWNIAPAMIGALAAAAVIALVLARHPAAAASSDSPPAATYDPALVAKGAWLSAIGNCSTCHTADKGATFAGGRPLSTPFGTLYATNITPDPDTGIGHWSSSDFLRAMHQGVDKEGQNLYPAFPFDHFTHVAADDVDALYAFLMTRDPVHAQAPANRIIVPRAAISVWKALYFTPGPLTPDATQDSSWNRGRYLVDGLGHCGACHTPRNALGAEKEREDLAGGTTDGWRAPALNETSPAPSPWTAGEIARYLRTGFDAAHGTAAGAMASVAHNLSTVPESEVNAIAVYIASRMAAPGAARATASGIAPGSLSAADAEPAARGGNTPIDPRQANDGDAIYRSACAGCHDGGRRGIALDHSTSTTDTSPANLIRVTLDGIHPREGEQGRIMPAFRGALDDTQLGSLVAFLRARFGHAPPWQDVGSEVAKAKRANEDGKSS